MPCLFSLYVNDMPSLSHHVVSALYADDTAIISASRKPTLFVNHLESYLNIFEQWLSEWRIAINVSKRTSIIFTPISKTLRDTKPVGHYNSISGVILYTRLNLSPHIY